MAVTSIWPIKGRVDKVINYARNPEKTHDKERLSELHEIEGVVEYAADEMKTEKRAYVTCLNLHSEETAAQEFMETKRLMHNEGGRSCYHGYQSFKADEVDADTAHSIGVALARELWGDRFQVVIATHCNTGHYHNHFVINSVSDVDGKKFYNSPADYRRMREVSDRLCREAKISVIEYPADRRANYGEWLAEKNGKPTMRSRIREDIDRAILASTTEREFQRVMKEMGYEVITKTPKGSPRVHPIVRIMDGGKNFRLDKLGEYYELDSIKQRIQNNYRRKTPFPEVAEDTKAPYYQYKEKAKKATGLYALYLYYCYELHIIVHKPTSVKKVSAFLREDVTKLDRYMPQQRKRNGEPTVRQDKLSKQNVILYLCGIIPVVWLGLLIAPCLKDGLPGLVQQFGTVMENPFQIQLCEDSVKTVLVLLLVYGIAIGVYLSTEHNYRRREEHGSAKWGTAGSVNKKYANKDKTENKLLTQNVAIGLDGRKHRRNLNVLVCGGSGAGKTRFYAKPNIMNANTSFVVLDPKGELLRDTGHLLEEKGYEIKVLDLIDMEKSHCYNPFVYISSDDDIQRLTTNLFKNTTPKGSQTQDPFWDQTAAMLLKALVCYLHYEAPPDEQNFSMVMEMIRAGDVKEDNEEYQSVLDELFERLEERNPEHIALKYYRAYHSGSAKTLKSIQISLVSRLEKFNLDSLAGITQCDEMDLGQIGEKKTAVFAVIPDNDSSFNFIVGMLYTQLFQQLYYQADSVHGGRLPVHVHFVMDEFANVALPDEFDKLLSTMRSREISVSIIIQNLAQLKALFEKQWESIVGNCDEFLYLGGNEQSTHEYVSKLMGKETIDTNTYGRSRGRNGSYSTNYQLAGRELMTPDEVRMLDNRYALLFIRGERPIRDLKYDILHHPNVALTTDGSAPAYTHGEDTRSIASMAFSFDKKVVKNAEKLEAEKHEFLLYSEEELEELLDEKEKKDNEEA